MQDESRNYKSRKILNNVNSCEIRGKVKSAIQKSVISYKETFSCSFHREPIFGQAP